MSLAYEQHGVRGHLCCHDWRSRIKLVTYGVVKSVVDIFVSLPSTGQLVIIVQLTRPVGVINRLLEEIFNHVSEMGNFSQWTVHTLLACKDTPGPPQQSGGFILANRIPWFQPLDMG